MRKLVSVLGVLLLTAFTLSVLSASADAGEKAKKKAKLEGVVNINTATSEQLQLLPLIGKKKAEEIIKYREKKGEFKAIEDIKNVKGVGDKLFDKIKDNIVVEGDTTVKKPEKKELKKKLEKKETEKKPEGE